MYKDLYNWCQTSLNGAADMEYTPAQDTGRGRRKSMIGTILTILIIFWIIKAIFGSGRRGGGAAASGRACSWARCSRTIITTALVRGPVPDPARAPADLAEAPDPAAAAAEALAEDEAVSAEAADKKFFQHETVACVHTKSVP